MLQEFAECYLLKTGSLFDVKSRHIRYVHMQLIIFVTSSSFCLHRCLAHIINLAMQAVISRRSKAKYYDGNPDNDELPEDLGASDRDEIGIICAICVKVGHNCYISIGLHLPRRYIRLPLSFLHLPYIKAHVWYRSGLGLVYNTISWLRYGPILSLCTIRSSGWLLYNIHLWATTTMILSIRGVKIPIDLVSSATDSIRRRVVLFKPVRVPTSDPKSEFLCQSSLVAQNRQTPLNPPSTPGISPMPSQPHITHIAIALVLSLNIWRRSYANNGQNVLVTAYTLKSSRTFHLNVTIT